MKYLKNYKIFESNTEYIDSICEKYGIENYTINDDMTIDGDGDVDLSDNQLTKLPLKFKNVSGDFDCYDNNLTSLEGCPKQVDGDFVCSDNNLTSLEGSPKQVGGNFNCAYNVLTSLEGCPEKVGGYFGCSYNKLTSLEGCPEKVGGYFGCSNNKLASFNHLPDYIRGEFFCTGNLIHNIWVLFQDYSKIELFNDYFMIYEPEDGSQPEILLSRVNDFLETIGKPQVEKVKGYINI